MFGFLRLEEEIEDKELMIQAHLVSMRSLSIEHSHQLMPKIIYTPIRLFILHYISLKYYPFINFVITFSSYSYLPLSFLYE